MSQDAVESLLGRIITDALFREHAAASLERAGRSVGLSLSGPELRGLEGLDFVLVGQVADSIDSAIRRS